MNAPQISKLPIHNARRYGPIGTCIYCGSRDRLTKEHIIPFAAGGCWVLPSASCRNCSKITSAFEGEVLRTIIGPLRMLYNMPTRRKEERPEQIPLKVKYLNSESWEIAYIDRRICPFLVAFPLYPMPNAIAGVLSTGNRSAATTSMWLRGAGFWRNRDAHLQWLCDALGAVAVMPEATMHAEPFCLMLAKVAHAFAVAELGPQGFQAFLPEMIRTRDLSNRAHVIGGGKGNESASENLHDLEFDTVVGTDPSVIVVRIRILGILGTPTYFVAVGRRNTSGYPASS